jgi:hypothetical protein
MCRRIAGLFHPEHLHDLVAQMIDHLDRNATLGRFVERARSIAVERRAREREATARRVMASPHRSAKGVGDVFSRADVGVVWLQDAQPVLDSQTRSAVKSGIALASEQYPTKHSTTFANAKTSRVGVKEKFPFPPRWHLGDGPLCRHRRDLDCFALASF